MCILVDLYACLALQQLVEEIFPTVRAGREIVQVADIARLLQQAV